MNTHTHTHPLRTFFAASGSLFGTTKKIDQQRRPCNKDTRNPTFHTTGTKTNQSLQKQEGITQATISTQHHISLRRTCYPVSCRRFNQGPDGIERAAIRSIDVRASSLNIDNLYHVDDVFVAEFPNFGQTNDECTTSAAHHYSAIAREYRYSNGDLGSVDSSGYSCSRPTKE